MSPSLSQAGWRTLAYAAVFGQGVKRHELARFLLSADVFSPSSLDALWQQWRLEGRVLRKDRIPLSPFWPQFALLRFFARSVPWVRSIWLTGSVAAGTPQEKDDLDFLVIVDTRRLWLSRFFLVGLSVFFARARTRAMSESSARGRWCFNMWLEPEALSLESSVQSVYVARELVQAIPLYVRVGVPSGELLERNPWVGGFCKMGGRAGLRRAQRAHKHFPFFPRGNIFPFPLFFDWLNRFAWRWQWRRIVKTQTREKVVFNQAFFHPRDTQFSVVREYERICTLQGISPYETNQTTRTNT